MCTECMWRNGNAIACAVEFGDRRCADVDVLLTSSIMAGVVVNGTGAATAARVSGTITGSTGTYCTSRNHFRLPNDIRDENMRRYRERRLMNTFKSVDRDLSTKDELLDGYDDRLENDRNVDVSYYTPADSSLLQNKVEFLSKLSLRKRRRVGVRKQTGYCTRGNYDITGHIRLESEEMNRERKEREKERRMKEKPTYDWNWEMTARERTARDLQITCRVQQRRMNEHVTVADEVITKTITVAERDVQNVTCMMPPTNYRPVLTWSVSSSSVTTKNVYGVKCSVPYTTGTEFCSVEGGGGGGPGGLITNRVRACSRGDFIDKTSDQRVYVVVEYLSRITDTYTSGQVLDCLDGYNYMYAGGDYIADNSIPIRYRCPTNGEDDDVGKEKSRTSLEQIALVYSRRVTRDNDDDEDDKYSNIAMNRPPPPPHPRQDILYKGTKSGMISSFDR